MTILDTTLQFELTLEYPIANSIPGSNINFVPGVTGPLYRILSFIKYE